MNTTTKQSSGTTTDDVCIAIDKFERALTLAAADLANAKQALTDHRAGDLERCLDEFERHARCDGLGVGHASHIIRRLVREHLNII